MTDYTNGRYNVFEGRGPAAALIGRIDNDEFIRNDLGKLLYRIDDDQVYEVGSGDYIGEICPTEDGRAMVLNNRHVALLTIVPE
ncbi:hypothetical protein [Pseudomonas protegens]|uniref:hypothetical protein n=1 Tax=Pseudomonas protegens TaxID=380021 RepID=UPI000F4660A1|nr:hypothetical protein [Pseudomonas protegens]MDP9504564.1 hypothetical protein [Pseudomonas protegens]ROL86528.1 hypothetical protein BK639_28410 [Pseudomonas protegens]ROL95134.1 hypothetical protein BK640_29030 [Pseudomonas protegens]ROL97877.1 hypothetical protein BK641_27075 [Pseudomonas protegens]ROM07663.1 hypothetical protein BK642_13975 [Pseudomonas protegens]